MHKTQLHKTLAVCASHHIVLNSNLVMHCTCYVAAAELFASLYFSSRAVSSRLRTLVIALSAQDYENVILSSMQSSTASQTSDLCLGECFIIKRRCFADPLYINSKNGKVCMHGVMQHD